jgi:hypothetical protein
MPAIRLIAQRAIGILGKTLDTPAREMARMLTVSAELVRETVSV